MGNQKGAQGDGKEDSHKGDDRPHRQFPPDVMAVVNRRVYRPVDGFRGASQSRGGVKPLKDRQDDQGDQKTDIHSCLI